LDNQNYALPLPVVERVIRAIEITHLPKAPDIVLGVVNIQGEIIPVINIRKRFQLPEREIALNDQFIIGRLAQRKVVLAADIVSGILERSEEDVLAVEKINPGLRYVSGVVKLEDGLLLIHDLNRFLSLDEDRALDKAAKGK
jgi:purine-binding chemotaxis protein CheW